MKMFDRDPHAQISERDFAQSGIWTLRAPMLALANPDPALSFPAGTTLQPKLFFRNTTDHQVNATTQFNWRAENTNGKVLGPTLNLQPYETRLVEIGKLPAVQGPPQNAHWAAVVVRTSGPPDEIMAVAASCDETLRYGAQTPFSDQLTHRWEGGKWEYDRNHDSIITAGNGGTKPIQASFAIYYAQGKRKYEVKQTLQPEEQLWIDIGDIIRRQIPDDGGATLPPDLTSGSYQFSDLTNRAVGRLFEGKVIYDKSNGHVSYGCASCCAYLGAPWVVLDPVGIAISTYGQIDTLANDGCDGYSSSVLDGFTAWNTANVAVAKINPISANISGVAAGQTTESSYGQVTQGGTDFKRCRVGHYNPSGTVGVGLSIVTSNYIFLDMEGNRCLYMLYCPNGNTASTCGKQVPAVTVDGPPVNVCRNYLWDHRISFNGTCFPVGKSELASTAVNCN